MLCQLVCNEDNELSLLSFEPEREKVNPLFGWFLIAYSCTNLQCSFFITFFFNLSFLYYPIGLGYKLNSFC